MSPKQWLALLCFYFSYLLFGASIFYHIEHDLETITRQDTYNSRMAVNGKIIILTLFKTVLIFFVVNFFEVVVVFTWKI